MLALRNPGEAYRRIDFDARVEGADPQALVVLCYETLIAALGSAIFAHERRDNAAKSNALTRAISAITALQLGVRGEAGVAAALHQFLEAGRRTLLDNALSFDSRRIAALRQDFQDIAGALSAAQAGGKA